MNPKYRALIWEQSRVTGVIAAWCYGVGLLIMMAIWATVPDKDVAEWGESAVYFAALAAALASSVRLDINGHLATDFEPRLARLPVKTVALVTIPLVARAVFLALLCAALTATFALLYPATLPVVWALLPLEIYAVAQAVAWSRRSLTGIDYSLYAALIVAIAVYQIPGRGLRSLLGLYGSHPYLFFAVIVIAGCGVALLGVHLQRRDERYGLPTATEIREWFVTLGYSPDKPFASPRAAQQWYEQRAYGWVLPLYAFGVITVMVLTMAGLEFAPGARTSAHPTLASLTAQLIPFVALSIAAVVAGAATMGKADSFCLVRPAPSSLFGAAKLFVQSRALTITLLSALALSILALLMVGSADLRFMWNAVQLGEATWVDLLVFILGPFFLAAIIAWMALSLRTPTVMAFPFLFYIVWFGTSVYLGSLEDSPPDIRALQVAAWSIILYMLLVPVVVYLRALRARAISPSRLKFIIPAWIGGASLLALYTVSDQPLSRDFVLLLGALSLGIMGMLLMPFAAVPLRIDRSRHG